MRLSANPSSRIIVVHGPHAMIFNVYGTLLLPHSCNKKYPKFMEYIFSGNIYSSKM